MAKVDLGERQRQLDREHQRAVQRHAAHLETWEREAGTERGIARAKSIRRYRRRSWLPLVVGLGSLLVPFS